MISSSSPSLSDFGTHDESRYPELWEGCVGAWAPCLGPTGTRLHDFSRGSNWGTLTNMDAATDYTVANGKYSLDFDGINDYIDYGQNVTLGGSKEISFSAWIFRSTNGDFFPFTRYDTTIALAAERRADYFGTASSPVNGCVLIIVTAPNNSGFRGYTSNTSVTANKWCHIAATFYIDGASSIGRTYIDGSEVANTVLTSATQPTYFDVNGSVPYQGCSLVVSNGTRRYYSGSFSDLMAYRRILTPAEITILASDRGVAYQRRRRRSYFAEQITPAFRASWIKKPSQLIGGGIY